MSKLRLTRRLTRNRLRLLFALFFVALAVPTAVLVQQAFEQLELDVLRRQQNGAENLLRSIDAVLGAALREEDARSFADYGFLVVAGDPAASFVQRSRLSAFPVEGSLPGLIGYFQVDPAGELSTPLLPPEDVDAGAYGIDTTERAARADLEQRIRELLSQNELLRGRREAGPVLAAERPSEPRARPAAVAISPAAVDVARDAAADSPAQAAFDRLSQSAAEPEAQAREFSAAEGAGRSDAAPPGAADAPQAQQLATAPLRAARIERAAVPELKSEADAIEEQAALASTAAEIRVSTFESELEPFVFSRLGTGHFVMFRNAWRDGRRFVQGALIEQAPFLGAAIGAPFSSTELAASTRLGVSHAGRLLGTFGAAEPAEGGIALYRARLSPPFAELELGLTSHGLPRAPGYALLVWLSVTLLSVLTAGMVLLYRFSWGQVELARRQQDFVSAVSHELKTPLTSIRMYGEMLKSGWADEDKRQAYYDFIFQESERLSRLIENVLQLARMTRQTSELALEARSIAQWLDLAESKVATQLESAGFALERSSADGLGDELLELDPDGFAQIVINLVDNAVKFSADVGDKRIELRAARRRDGWIVFSVRDFGPGVPRSKMRRLFELFYRPDNALTRATAGTGIGLALVKQLAEAMHGKVDVRNRDPGAEFSVAFPSRACA